MRPVMRYAGMMFALLWLVPHSSLPGQTTIVAPAAARSYEIPAALTIAGKPEERGRIYGERFQGGIKHFLDNEIYRALLDKPNGKAATLAYAAECAKTIEAECPIIYQELNGIAAGTGLSLDEVVLITLHEELYHRGVLPKVQHCTAVAVAGADNSEGHTYVGRTWDWMQSVAGTSSVVQWRREEGPSLLAYGFPGLWVGAGMNDRGIALCWTSASLGDHAMGVRVGLPSYVLLAHLLYQTDLDGVIRAAQRDKHAGWFTFVIADAEGNLLNLEGSPQGIVIERSRTRLARVAYGSQQMAGASPDGQVKLHPRCQKMYDLLESSAGNNGRSTLQNYFTDPRAGIMAGKSTIDMMVFDVTAKTAYLSRGPHYRLDWREFHFDKK